MRAFALFQNSASLLTYNAIKLGSIKFSVDYKKNVRFCALSKLRSFVSNVIFYEGSQEKKFPNTEKKSST